jgi:hypothetical protein
LVWITNGTIYLGILILLKLRKVEKHLEGKIAEALMAKGTLFSKDPELVDLLAVK